MCRCRTARREAHTYSLTSIDWSEPQKRHLNLVGSLAFFLVVTFLPDLRRRPMVSAPLPQQAQRRGDAASQRLGRGTRRRALGQAGGDALPCATGGVCATALLVRATHARTRADTDADAHTSTTTAAASARVTQPVACTISKPQE